MRLLKLDDNGALSLTQARANYKAFGASSERHKQFVRLPNPDEVA